MEAWKFGQASRYAAITKDTKNHKGHKGDFGGLADWEIGKVWGAAPRPGREKFSLHPRHVCDVPEGDAKAAQEIQEIQEIQERPCGATDESAVLEPIRRALARVLFSVLRSPFSGALQRPFRLHRRQGRRPGL